MRKFAVWLALAAACAAAGCAEITKSVNGAGKTVDGWFSPNS